MLVSAYQDLENLSLYQQNVDNIGQNDLSSNKKHYYLFQNLSKTVLISFYHVTIGIFTCFRKIYGLNLEFQAYLIFKGLIFWGACIWRRICVSE